MRRVLSGWGHQLSYLLGLLATFPVLQSWSALPWPHWDYPGGTACSNLTTTPRMYELKSCVASWPGWRAGGYFVVILAITPTAGMTVPVHAERPVACSGRKQVNLAFSWRHFPSQCRSSALVHCVVVGWNEQLCVQA